PVEVEVLHEEGRGDETRPVVHPALLHELAHARVDEREARAALLPERQKLGVVIPSIAARAVVLARDGRECGRHLMVEVAPAELADEGLTAWPTGGPPRHLDRREAAEVQVGAET